MAALETEALIEDKGLVAVVQTEVVDFHHREITVGGMGHQSQVDQDLRISVVDAVELVIGRLSVPQLKEFHFIKLTQPQYYGL